MAKHVQKQFFRNDAFSYFKMFISLSSQKYQSTTTTGWIGGGWVLQNYISKNNAMFEVEKCGRTSENSNSLFFLFYLFFFICTTVI